MQKIYLTAKKGKRRFHALYDKIDRKDVFAEAWNRVKANKGAGGMDGISIQDIVAYGEEKFLEEIETELKEGNYHPKAVKRVLIPKPSHLLLPCYPDGAGSPQRDGETSRVPGELSAEAGGRQEQAPGSNLHCQALGEYRLWNVEESHRIPGTGEKNRGRNCLKSAVGAFIMETNIAEKGYPCSFSAFKIED